MDVIVSIHAIKHVYLHYAIGRDTPYPLLRPFGPLLGT